jgi:hypothetical protein
VAIRRVTLLIVSASLAPGAVAPAASAAPVRQPVTVAACRGAAWRARLVCERLRFGVSPTPSVAEITPSAPCTLEDHADGIFDPLPGPDGTGSSLGTGNALLSLCVFGAAPPLARNGVALVGDSHAGMWRAALAIVAHSLAWEGASVTRASCPFSAGVPIIPQVVAASCLRWRLDVVKWFNANPQIGTIFLAAHFSARVVPAPGQTAFDASVAGDLAAWRELPPTVKHIVVLRDPPDAGRATAPCVQAAIDRHKQAGIACALKRGRSLHRDPAVAAAGLFGPRASVIDMSSYFCDKRLCYPVIGGVLVYADSNHITRAYSETLAPYLRRQIGVLLRAWAVGPPAI